MPRLHVARGKLKLAFLHFSDADEALEDALGGAAPVREEKLMHVEAATRETLTLIHLSQAALHQVFRQ
jgi:hypothetical protein